MKSGMMPRGDSALAHAISAARRQAVDPAAVARVQSRVLAAVDGTPAPASPAGPLWWSRWRWPYVGGGVLLWLGALRLLPIEPAPAQHVPPPAVIASSARAPAVAEPAQRAVAVPAPIAATSITLPAATSEPRAAPAPRRAPHASTHAPVRSMQSAPVLDPEAELALLRRALSALPTRPTLALELAQEHARLYAHGAFAQEREAIAIDASLALQRTASAEARVRRFLSAYPRSPHAPRMRALLGPQRSPASPTQGQAPTLRRRENP